MRFIPLSISQKGLQQHLEELGVNYKRLAGYFDNGANDTWIAKKIKHSRHSVHKWRKVYEQEQKRDKDNEAVDKLKD